MKITPRQYQIDAVNAARTALTKNKRVLIIAPTGSGKGLLQAMIVQSAMKKRKPRVLVLCHQAHLLEQNEKQIKNLLPTCDTGIYCAGLGRKEVNKMVILASRDSLGNNPEACGKFDIIVIDEAHMVANDVLKAKTNYSKILKYQEQAYVIGMTATPMRLTGGNIWGKGKYFEKVAYNIGMRMLIDEGYLSDYVFPEVESHIDTSEVKSARGDFVNKQLTEVSSTNEVVEKCIDSWEKYASDRKCSIFFCCSRAHAQVVQEHLTERIGEENVCYVDGETTNRTKLFQDIKNGKYKAIVNISVLSTGFDAPLIDCVVGLRATQSSSLFVQMFGRGLRISPDKKNVLFLDMTSNNERFESIEEPYSKKGYIKKDHDKKSDKPGEAVLKTCSECLYEIPAATTVCGCCGFVFYNHSTEAYTQKNNYTLKGVTCKFHLTRKNDPCFVYSFWTKERQKSFDKYIMADSSISWARKQAREFIAAHFSEQGKIPQTLRCANPMDKYPKITLSGSQDVVHACQHLNLSYIKEGDDYKITCNHCNHKYTHKKDSYYGFW